MKKIKLISCAGCVSLPSFSLSSFILHLLSPLLFTLAFTLGLSLPLSAQAQTPNNVSINNLEGRSHTSPTLHRNATGSCDSTCEAMNMAAPASSMQGAFITRLTPCSAGYTGKKTQSRNQNPDGSYTAWVDADTSLCTCAPTHQDTTQACTLPLSGTYIQRTNWTCTANIGSWGSPSTITNNCFTPCSLPSPSTQYTSGSCPAGYTGAYYYERTSSCPGGVGANSTSVWSGWNLTSNTCVPRRYTASEFSGVYESPHSEGQTGIYYIYNNTGVTFTMSPNPQGGWGPYIISDYEGYTYAFESTVPYYYLGAGNVQTWTAGTWFALPSGAPSIGRLTLPNGQVLTGTITTQFSHFTITP